jgi:hypothetical protein
VQQFAEMCQTVAQARVRAAWELQTRLGDRSVRIEAEQATERAEYTRLLYGGLISVSSKPQALAAKLAKELMPAEIVGAALRNDAEPLVRKAHVAKRHAALILATLRQKRATLLALQAVRLGDRITIHVLHGKHFKSLDKASPGQRASALLPLMLLASNVPLLIDQPEDHVSGRFLAGRGAEMILARRGQQQTLFGSTNANVIVLGKADRTFKLECPDGQVGVIAREGSRQAMRDDILEITEGGRGAFEARRDFYDGKHDGDGET